MRRAELLLGLFPGLWLVLGAGCSPASGPGAGNGVGAGDNGGASANGGTGGIPTGGTAGVANGGTGNIVTTGGAGGSGGTDSCDSLMVTSREVSPTVMLLVDNSSSMFETQPPAWPILYSALMSPTDGAVVALQDRIYFGFVSFKGSPMASSEGADACADMTTRVDPALNNHGAIDAVYSGVTWSPGTKWETPTGHAIGKAAEILAAFNTDPPGPKYLLLVTDGNPNTCATLDPQCGQDISIRAAQMAAAQSIQTFVFGIGDIVTQPNNGCPTSGRCGSDHLQDMANAGVGLPVQAPAENFRYESCNLNQMLTATYAAAGEIPGTAPYFTAATREELLPKLTALLSGVTSCTLDMDAIVTGDAALGTVTITPDGGAQRPLTINNATDGWMLEANNYQVTLTGQACVDYQAGNAQVSIDFPCRVAEPR